jgi:lipopolysaccharide assembly outer membrane protein LptD (OstA)
MKKLTLLILILIPLSVFAQESKPNEGDQKESFTVQSPVVAQVQDSTITLTKNVKITTDRLYLEADSVVYDMRDKSFTAYNYKELKFKGELILSEKPKSIIRYKFKSDKIHID